MAEPIFFASRQHYASARMANAGGLNPRRSSLTYCGGPTDGESYMNRWPPRPEGPCVAWEPESGRCSSPIDYVTARLCAKHYRRWKNTGRYDVKSKVERFWDSVDTDGPIPRWAPFLGQCWLWTAATGPFGHGSFRVGGRKSARQMSHRYAYEMVIGPIPEGLVLDHLCRIHSCVNPYHLDACTQRVNLLRAPESFQAINANKTHCKRGHPFDEANTIIRPGGRGCRQCRDDGRRKRYAEWRG